MVNEPGCDQSQGGLSMEADYQHLSKLLASLYHELRKVQGKVTSVGIQCSQSLHCKDSPVDVGSIAHESTTGKKTKDAPIDKISKVVPKDPISTCLNIQAEPTLKCGAAELGNDLI